jgi:hypothetical protein
MAAPNPAGVISSSAGVQTTALAQIRQLVSPATAAPTAAAGVNWHGGLLAGMVVAVLFLAYWYKRIL